MSFIIQFGVEATWTKVTVSFNATTTPIAVSPGTILWTPPQPGLVRAFTVNDNSGSPLVGNGGATTLSIGVEGQTVTIIAVATALATFGTQLIGWGNQGPSTGGASCGVGDGGIVVAPAGSIPGRAAVARTIRGFANAGTITGTLEFRFEFRPFGTGTF